MKHLLLLTLFAAPLCADESVLRTAISYSALTLSATSSLMNGKVLKFEYKHGNPLIALPTYLGGQILPFICIAAQNGKKTATHLAAGSLLALTGSSLSWKQLPSNPLTRPMIFKTMGTVIKNSAKTGLFAAGAYNYFQGFSSVASAKKQ